MTDFIHEMELVLTNVRVQRQDSILFLYVNKKCEPDEKP